MNTAALLGNLIKIFSLHLIFMSVHAEYIK